MMTPAARAAIVALAFALATGATLLAGDQTGTAAKVPGSARSTSVVGNVWNADNTPIQGARVQLRNVVTGRIEATAVADDTGRFAFTALAEGTYLVELVTDTGKTIAVGHVFAIAPGETVATFVRLGAKAPWFSGFFNNAAAAVVSTAATQGITALAPAGRPASAGK